MVKRKINSSNLDYITNIYIACAKETNNITGKK